MLVKIYHIKNLKYAQGIELYFHLQIMDSKIVFVKKRKQRMKEFEYFCLKSHTLPPDFVCSYLLLS